MTLNIAIDNWRLVCSWRWIFQISNGRNCVRSFSNNILHYRCGFRVDAGRFKHRVLLRVCRICCLFFGFDEFLISGRFTDSRRYVQRRVMLLHFVDWRIVWHRRNHRRLLILHLAVCRVHARVWWIINAVVELSGDTAAVYHVILFVGYRIDWRWIERLRAVRRKQSIVWHFANGHCARNMLIFLLKWIRVVKISIQFVCLVEISTIFMPISRQTLQRCLRFSDQRFIVFYVRTFL